MKGCNHYLVPVLLVMITFVLYVSSSSLIKDHKKGAQLLNKAGNVGISKKVCQNQNNFPLTSTDTTPKLVLFGSIEGKSYYYDNTVQMTWSSALAHCKASGFQLASITTETQFKFLKESGKSGVLPGGLYWTAGRESREWRMFSWHTTGKELPSIFTGSIGSNVEADYYICLDLFSESGALLAEECDVEEYVLCETQ